MGLLDKWNKNKFSIYSSEEKTVLKLIDSIGKWLGELINVTENKTDLYGDHKGTWQGLRPTQTAEATTSILESHETRLNGHDAQLAESVQQIRTLETIKANKNDIFTMANMGQDVKEAMTGGSVAVVGGASVDINNLSLKIQEDIGEMVVLPYTETTTLFKVVDGKVVEDTTTSNYKSAVATVVSGLKLQISYFASNQYTVIMFSDENGNVKGDVITPQTSGSATKYDYDLITPNGATKVYVIKAASVGFQTVIKHLKYVPIANKKYVDSIKTDVNALKTEINALDVHSYFIFFANKVYPTFSIQDGIITVNMPKGHNRYTRMFAFDKYSNNVATLWTSEYEENAGEKRYNPTYVLKNSEGLYWDFDSNTLVVEDINKVKNYRNILLLYNANGVIGGGYFEKYVFTDEAQQNRNAVQLSTHTHTFINRECMMDGYPELTHIATKHVIESGYNHIRVSVRFTSDNVPVLLHDETINRTARNADGTILPQLINIADITFSDVIAYDFGIYAGDSFKGTKIGTLEEFLKICAYLGVFPTLEIKPRTITLEQTKVITDMISKYGLTHVTTISSDIDSVLNNFFGICQTYNYAVICHPSNAEVDRVLTYKNPDNEVRLDVFADDVLTQDFLNYASSKNVGIKIGSAYNLASVADFIERGANFIEVANVPFVKSQLKTYYLMNN